MTQYTDQLRGREARMNVNTTNVEHFLDPKHPIVTRTDLKGKITYANPAFIEISGYSEQELLGQPHNIVRHPDMPAKAFEDLWRTLQANKPWHGLVKNRSKDGGFYWVEAYVTPLTENGEKIGYQSVRTAPSQADKAAAEALYRAVKNGQQAFPMTALSKASTLKFKIGIIFFFLFLISLIPLFAQGILAWGSTAFFSVVFLISWLWIANEVNRPLSVFHDAMEKLGEGNFRADIKLKTHAEFLHIVDDLKALQVNLRAMISDILLAATNVREEAKILTTNVHNIIQSSNRQTQGIQEVTVALEELSTAVNEISEATKKSTDSATEAQRIVNVGKEQMHASFEASENIVNAVNSARNQLGNLNDAVAKINLITGAIHEIAEQTNLLALNAAIEAARAGESGRGFAVVADQVRGLSDRTANSTKDISETVINIQAGTASSYATMDQAMVQVEEASKLIKSSDDSLNAIREASSCVAQAAGEIADSLVQQSRISIDVANSMEKMNELTSDNNKSIQQMENAINHLAITSSNLYALVQRFEKFI